MPRSSREGGPEAGGRAPGCRILPVPECVERVSGGAAPGVSSLPPTTASPMRPLTVALLVLASASASSQSLPDPAQAYLGEWTVPDEDTGEPEAVVEIYEEDGKVHGRLVRSLEDSAEDGAIRCEECEGDFQGADLRGVTLLQGLEWNGDRFEGGELLDPRSGNRYRLSLSLEDGRLHVRGYKGIKLFGRTQVWERAE